MKRYVDGKEVQAFCQAFEYSRRDENPLPDYWNEWYEQFDEVKNHRVNGAYIAKRFNMIIDFIKDPKNKVTYQITEQEVLITFPNGWAKLYRDILINRFLLPHIACFSLVHIPSQIKDFIIMKESFDHLNKTEIMEYCFYGTPVGESGLADYSAKLGSVTGYFQDQNFRRRSDKYVGLLHVKGVKFAMTASRPYQTSETIKKSDEEKYKKMYTQNYNKYIERIKQIEDSSSLFKVDDIKRENEVFNAIVKKLKSRYNIEL